MRALFIYSYGPPDDVVSAKHMGDFAENLNSKGYKVDFWCGNRSYRNPKVTYLKQEQIFGVNYERIANFGIKSVILRKVLNLFIFNLVLFKRIFFRKFLRDYDLIVTSTDPILNFVLVSNLVKKFNDKTKIILWSLDLYPEAFEASGKIKKSSFIYEALCWYANFGYKKIDFFISIGECMTSRLSSYDIKNLEYLYPWALNDDHELSQDEANLYRKKNYPLDKKILLLSGSFGYAHVSNKFFDFLDQINKMPNILLVCSIRGNKAKDVIDYINRNNINCILKDFVPLKDLANHLNSVDVHITVVNEKWSGIVVPSKFFGSLHSGKPTLYIGPNSSEVSKVINKHKTGWSCDNNFYEILQNINDAPQMLIDEMSLNAKSYYKENIVMAKQIERILDKLKADLYD